jgi:hypothetical protein
MPRENTNGELILLLSTCTTITMKFVCSTGAAESHAAKFHPAEAARKVRIFLFAIFLRGGWKGESVTTGLVAPSPHPSPPLYMPIVLRGGWKSEPLTTGFVAPTPPPTPVFHGSRPSQY